MPKQSSIIPTVHTLGQHTALPGLQAPYATISDAELYQTSPLLNADHVDALLISSMPGDIYDQGVANRLREVKATVYGFVSIGRPKHDSGAVFHAAIKRLGLIYLEGLRTGNYAVSNMVYEHCRTTRLWFDDRKNTSNAKMAYAMLMEYICCDVFAGMTPRQKLECGQTLYRLEGVQ